MISWLMELKQGDILEAGWELWIRLAMVRVGQPAVKFGTRASASYRLLLGVLSGPRGFQLVRVGTLHPGAEYGS